MRPFRSIRLAYIEDLDKDPDVDKSIEGQSKPWIQASAGYGWTKEFLEATGLKAGQTFGHEPNDLSAHADDKIFRIYGKSC